MSEKISIREFARRVGVADTSVHKAIAAGDLKDIITVTDKGKKEVDYEKALKQWQDSGRGSQKVVKPSVTEKITPETKTPVSTDTGAGMSYTESKRRSAMYEQQMKGLELAEKQGTLVNKSKVFKQLFDLGQNLRNNLLTIPDRIIDELLATENRNEAHQKLYESIAGELERLSNTPKFD